MEWIIDNWELIVALVCAACCVFENIIFFVLEPHDNKIANLREWLLYAVVEAEKRFQGGTGQIKLRYVYNLAIEKFPWLPKVITFDKFSQYVDEALVWFRIQLETNQNVRDYIGGENG